MRRFFASLACLFVLISGPSRPFAEPEGDREEDVEETFKPKRLWHFAAVPAWWMAWLSAHEGTHALMSQYWDYEVASFRPYPHTAIVDDSGNAKFFWGATYLRCSRKEGLHLDGSRYVEGPYWPRCKDGAGLAAISISPYVLNATVFTVTDLVLSYHVDIDSTAGGILFVGGMVGPWVNSLFGSNFLTGGPDFATFSERTGIPKWTTTLAFDSMMAVGAWRLYVHGRDLLFDGTRKREGKSWTLLPTFGESTGLSLSFGW